jgi:hypothetical protein
MNDTDKWKELEKMDHRTKEYKNQLKEYCKLYVED